MLEMESTVKLMINEVVFRPRCSVDGVGRVSELRLLIASRMQSCNARLRCNIAAKTRVEQRVVYVQNERDLNKAKNKTTAVR